MHDAVNYSDLQQMARPAGANGFKEECCSVQHPKPCLNWLWQVLYCTVQMQKLLPTPGRQCANMAGSFCSRLVICPWHAGKDRLPQLGHMLAFHHLASGLCAGARKGGWGCPELHEPPGHRRLATCVCLWITLSPSSCLGIRSAQAEARVLSAWSARHSCCA